MVLPSLDDLLLAGITLADNIVIVNKESSNAVGEDILADCNTIVSVQTIYRLSTLHCAFVPLLIWPYIYLQVQLYCIDKDNTGILYSLGTIKNNKICKTIDGETYAAGLANAIPLLWPHTV